MRQLIIALLVSLATFSRADTQLWDEPQTNADLQRQIAASQIQSIQQEQQQFLVLQRSAMTAFSKGTVVLVPDWSQHAASPRAVNYLRNYLIDYGWNTVAMMVPPGTGSQELTDLQSYQQLLLQRLKLVMLEAEKSPGAIVVIGLGHSGAVLNTLYKNDELKAPQALVLIGAAIQETNLNEQVAQAISQHKIPTLDMLPQSDNSFATHSSTLRLQLVRKHLKEMYRQRLLPGTVEQNQVWLGREILGWLHYIGY